MSSTPPPPPQFTTNTPIDDRAREFRGRYQQIFNEVSKVIVGHQDIIHGVLASLFVGGHVLLEGVPGLGKTLLIRTLSEVLDLKFNRIQFTPDLMPSDITGTEIINETPEGHREFRFLPGPLFAQIVLADEINRATPKTQSALLEAMQEKSVTVSGTIHKLEKPFFVMATQNPLEQEGTYPLPEAQLDRFLFKLVVSYSGRRELATILERTTRNEFPIPDKVMDGPEIIQWQNLIRVVIIAEPVQDYAIRLILATHPGGEFQTPETEKYIRCGSSPRGAQALALSAKIRGLLSGRFQVSFQDVRAMYLQCLRHRILLNFEAQAEGISSDTILTKILEQVPERGPEFAGR